MPTLTSFPITLTPEMMYAHQGRAANARPLHERAQAMYRSSIETALELVQPAAMYDLFDVGSVTDDGLTLTNGQRLRSRLIVHQLSRASKLAVAICTIGPRLPAASTAAFSAGDSMMGFLLDTAGSLAVKSVAIGLLGHITRQAQDLGLSASFSIAPGSAECTLEDQRAVFDLLLARDIGVRLTDSMVMVPIKSVSWVVGIGVNMPSQLEHSQCEFCPRRETCPSSRLRQGDHNLAAMPAEQ